MSQAENREAVKLGDKRKRDESELQTVIQNHDVLQCYPWCTLDKRLDKKSEIEKLGNLKFFEGAVLEVPMVFIGFFHSGSVWPSPCYKKFAQEENMLQRYNQISSVNGSPVMHN